MAESNNKMPRRNIELLTVFEKNLRYGGYCKLTLDTLSKQLIVDPYDEKVKMVSALFDWNFIVVANILFIETPGDISNFAIIFNNVKSGKTVANVVTKDKVVNDENFTSTFINKFFIPLLAKLDNPVLSNIVENFINFCDNDKKEMFKNILNENNVGQNLNLFSNDNIIRRETRKRSRPGSVLPRTRTLNNVITLSDEEEDIIEPQPPKRRRTGNKKKQQYTNFKLLKYKIGDEIRQKLLVFNDKNDQNKCYYFQWSKKKNVFECLNCQHRNYELFKKRPVVKAIIKENLDGEECVESDYHKCRMSKYVKWSRGERKILRKPDYRITESNVNGSKRQRLVVFDPSNKELCHEYALKSKKDVFDCCGCTELRKTTRAKIYYQNTPDEYLEIYSDEHICDLRPYNNSNQISKIQRILKKPNYEIQNVLFRGKKSKKLIVFDEEDRDWCHELCFENTRFICRRCVKKQRSVYAHLKEDEDGNEYLRLGPTKHVCSLIPYQSEKDKQEIIIDASQFKLIPSEKKEGTFEIFIFIGDDNGLCYEFSYITKSYSCVGCRKKDNYYVIRLCKKDDGEYFIQMKNDQQHVCKPKKFNDGQPESDETPKPAENYILYQNENGTKKMIVFPANRNDKKYCYDYLLDRTIFRCNKCAKLKKHVSAKFITKKDSDEKHLELGPAKHVCQKLEFSTIKKSIIKKLSYDEVFPSKSKKDESQIITKFELQPNKKNIKDAILIVFHSTDKSLCYEFHILQSVGRYRCINCEKLKTRVSGKLSKDKNGKTCFIMGDKEHICKPIKYQKEIPKFTNFIMLHENDPNKVPKMIVYTNDARTHCYEYRKENLHFICNGCTGKKSYAKFMKDSDGNGYVDFCTEKHTCTPQRYNPVKYEDDPIIDKSKFETFPNTLKELNSKLFIFNSNNRKFGYEYYQQKDVNARYYCYQCHRYLNKGVSAKLLKNVDGFYVKMSKAEHACEPQNFVETGHLFYSPNFMHQTSADNKQMIKAIYSKDNKLCYKFEYDNDLQIYYCISCQHRNLFVPGKIIKCDGKECFFVGYDHKCFPMPI